MKHIAILMLLATVAFAQSGFSPAVVQCLEQCCDRTGGYWDSSTEGCEIDYEDAYAVSSLDACDEECYETSGTYDPVASHGSAACCGSAAILLAAFAFAAKSNLTF